MPGPPPAAPAAKPQASALPALIPQAKAHEGEEHEEEAASAPAQATPAPAMAAAPAGPGAAPAVPGAAPAVPGAAPAVPGAAPAVPGATPGAAPAAPAGPPRFVPTPAQRLVGYLHHLHSGEEFGPVGTIVSILSGFALIFFAISGMWMYLQMFLNRRRLGRKEIFWK
jgi:hypothetical protein